MLMGVVIEERGFAPGFGYLCRAESCTLAIAVAIFLVVPDRSVSVLYFVVV